MPKFGVKSKAQLKQLHPKLQQLCNEAIKLTDFQILDAQRGRAEQEKAFRLGNSKVHFGDSAHNWVPAIAMDLFPAPYEWDNTAAFDHLHSVIAKIASGLNIPIRWGGDFNMDGNKTRNDNWDAGHYELYPWRTWSKQCKPYED